MSSVRLKISSEQKIIILAFLSCGIWIILITILGFLYPDYSHLHQTISVLGERYAPYPYALVQIVNFIQFGGMIVFIATELHKRLEPSSKTGTVLMVIIGFCIMLSGPFSGHYYNIDDFLTLMHIILGIPVFLLGYFIPFFFGRQISKNEGLRCVGVVSYILSLLMFITIILFFSFGDTTIGLYQRLYLGFFIIWVLYMSYYIIGDN